MQFNNMWILSIRIFLLKSKSVLDYTNLCYPNEYGENDKIFSLTKKIKMKKKYCFIFGKYRKLKTLKDHTFSKNIRFFGYLQ